MPVTPNAARLEPVVPESRAIEDLPIGKPNTLFFFTHHPGAWRVGSNGALLPDLARMVIKPGVNGVRQIPRGGTEADQWREAARDLSLNRNVTVLIPDTTISAAHLPEGVPEGPYLRKLTIRPKSARNQAAYYCTAWDVPVQLTPGLPLKTKFDQAKFDAWCQSLVESGRIAPPTEAIREDLLADRKATLSRVESTNFANPNLLESRVAIAQKAVDEVAKARLPAPKTGAK